MKKLARKAKKAVEQPPSWVLERDGVTQSFLGKFMECRMQCYLSFVKGYRSRTISRPLEFGNLVHYVLSHCYMGTKRPRGRDIDEGIKKHTELWKRIVGPISLKQQEERTYVEELARIVLAAYFHHWEEDFKQRKWTNLERTFDVPYTYDDGFQVPLRGRRDGLYSLPENGEGLFETKTKSMIDEDTIAELLPLDLQVNMYVFSREQQTGILPKEVCYNLIRRPGQRLTKKDGDINGLLARIETEVWNRPEHYFIRLLMDTSPEEIAHWKENIFHPLMEDVRAWAEGRLPTYMNPNALVSKYGKCDLYAALVYGNTKAYNTVTVPFTELMEVEDG